MGREIDLIIAVLAIGSGLLMLFGKGDLFLSSSRDPGRYSQYDMKKFERPCGVVILLTGLLTLADSYIQNVTFTIVYLVVIVLLFAWLFWFYRTKCRKS